MNMNKKQKYYTQSEAAGLINVSESSIKLYIKELSEEDKIGKFNKKNQPNDDGISTLINIARERNPYLKKYDEYEKIIENKDNEIKKLKTQIQEIKKENHELNKRYVEYSGQVSERFTNLQEQSNIIIAQLTKNNQELQKLTSESEESSEEVKDSFRKRFKYLLTGKK